MIKPGMFISDRYEIIDKVGAGGMADVYKAKCHRLNRFVAIKILKSEFSDDTNFVNKFRGEAQSAAGLSHPNIVNVYDVGEEDGLYYIVMELVEGITLKNFIERKGKLELKEAIGIAIQISQGMEAAHMNHIIHRDIKPQNIIISREGKVKVTDFGIAKAASSNTITSNAMGSVHYISPEQARGGYSDEKSDIYSLGVTLYEMLSGMVPFVGDNTVSVALLHIQGDATPIRQLDPNIPVSVDRIVQKCMQKKPERRYLSAGELIADLKKAIANPNGDFVKIAPTVINDSPTINISEDDMNHIKNASKRVANDFYEDDLLEEDLDDKSDLEDEEDLEGDVDPKLEKIMLFGGIGLTIILVLIILFLIGKASGLFKFSNNTKNNPGIESTINPEASTSPTPSDESEGLIDVPDVVGHTLEDASKLIEDANLSPRYTYEPSNLIEKDYVMKQSPADGEQLSKNDEVLLTVSSGPETFKLPDVMNKADEEAVTILTDNGLKVKHDYDYSDTVEKGNVIKTNPEPGSAVVEGDSVTITISRGEKLTSVYVPDLSNLTEEDAINLLKANSLKAGDINYKTSNRVEEGLVISQNYSVNEKVEEGTEISFTVSLGPEATEDPNAYSYIGTVTITENPFVDEMEEGTITLELTQDGVKTIVYEEVLTYSRFPLTVPIKGNSESDGKIRMYLNDELISGQWVVSFTKVAN